ncbi:MAG: isoprenyl transferase [Candidatus Omnitrophota bacterium]|jgi:undecaprenyl diphosphate synthase
MELKTIPRHVAIIMDGNGRWAAERGFMRAEGHRQGVKRAEEIIQAADDLGIQVLTLFAFSNENWTRPGAEVAILMKLFNNFLERQVNRLIENNIRVRFIGGTGRLSGGILSKMRALETKTAHNTGLILILAVNYGARQEIMDAARRFAASVREGSIGIEDLDERMFSGYLYTAELPDPDILIRTSGEMRLSNFLLWQLSYAEFYFYDKYWPEFKKEDLARVLRDFQKRQRRFGGIG